MTYTKKSIPEAVAILAGILNKTCGVSQSTVVPSARLVEDLGVDSLGMLEAVIEAEESFDVSIDAGELNPNMSISDLICLLQQKGAVDEDRG
jgi:acyl carrier protein